MWKLAPFEISLLYGILWSLQVLSPATRCWQYMATERPTVTDLKDMAEKPTKHIIFKVVRNHRWGISAIRDKSSSTPSHRTPSTTPQRPPRRNGGVVVHSRVSPRLLMTWYAHGRRRNSPRLHTIREWGQRQLQELRISVVTCPHGIKMRLVHHQRVRISILQSCGRQKKRECGWSQQGARCIWIHPQQVTKDQNLMIWQQRRRRRRSEVRRRDLLTR